MGSAADWMLALATAEQPPPTGDGEPVGPMLLRDLHHALLAAVVRGRIEVGLRRYGTLLRTNNGRDPVADLVQEIGDAAQYAAQAVEAGRLDRVDYLDALRAFEVLLRSCRP